MGFLELDIRTLLRALVIGNLVAMAMVFAYKSPGKHTMAQSARPLPAAHGGSVTARRQPVAPPPAQP